MTVLKIKVTRPCPRLLTTRLQFDPLQVGPLVSPVHLWQILVACNVLIAGSITRRLSCGLTAGLDHPQVLLPLVL